MYEPLNRLKFATLSSYYGQSRAGIKYLIEKNNRKKLCVLYQDTDFGKEILEAAQDQAKAMNSSIAENATNSPTDTDFTAHTPTLRAAASESVAMGPTIRAATRPHP